MIIPLIEWWLTWMHHLILNEPHALYTVWGSFTTLVNVEHNFLPRQFCNLWSKYTTSYVCDGWSHIYLRCSLCYLCIWPQQSYTDFNLHISFHPHIYCHTQTLACYSFFIHIIHPYNTLKSFFSIPFSPFISFYFNSL